MALRLRQTVSMRMEVTIMVDLTQVVIAVVGLIISAVSVFVIPYLKSKVSSEQLDTIKFWVNIAVEAAEMIYKGTGKGAEKKRYVEEFLKSKGFTLNMQELDALIEGAVLELKLNLNDDTESTV